MISKAPDATVFLSTAALIIGIFLTVTAAGLASSLPEDQKELARPIGPVDNKFRYRQFIRGTLSLLLIVNTVGTLSPFSLLLVNTLTTIQSAWIWVVFSYTLFVII